MNFASNDVASVSNQRRPRSISRKLAGGKVSDHRRKPSGSQQNQANQPGSEPLSRAILIRLAFDLCCLFASTDETPCCTIATRLRPKQRHIRPQTGRPSSEPLGLKAFQIIQLTIVFLDQQFSLEGTCGFMHILEILQLPVICF